MLAKQNTGGNAAKFFQGANAIFRNSQDRQGPRRNPSTPAELGAALVGKVYSEESFKGENISHLSCAFKRKVA
jgi:hypothetical protein